MSRRIPGERGRSLEGERTAAGRHPGWEGGPSRTGRREMVVGLVM